MFTHADIWRAIDTLARKNGLSTSGLARKAGLDPTSFNRSKRITPSGRPRWPSSESLAKILKCTNTTLEEFARLMNGEHAALRRAQVPIQDWRAVQGCEHFSDDGRPRGEAWQQLEVAGLDTQEVFGLRIHDELRQLCSAGDVVLADPRKMPQPGEKVILQHRDGRLLVGELRERSSEAIVLRSFVSEGGEEVRLAHEEYRWLARMTCLLLQPG